VPTFEEGVVADYLEATHAIGDHLLSVFAEVCDELGIAYFLTSGTLLGAVRSGSWIPWDDDVDVIMFREDYDRLRPRIEARLPAQVAFSCAETREDHITAIPRLVYLDSRRVHVGRHRSRVPLETKHIPLDIFILDRAPRNAFLRSLWSSLAFGLDKAAVARYTSARDVLAEPAIGRGRKAAELLGVLLTRVLPRGRWHALRTLLVTRPARWGGSGPFVATNYSTPAGRRMAFEESWYLPPGRVEFSGRLYPAPGDHAAVLTELYGRDYLVPPDVVDRQPVHIRGGLEASLVDRAWTIGPQAAVVPDVPEPPEPPEPAPPEVPDVVHGEGSSFRHQVLWSLVARTSAAILQVLVLVLLARGLEPSLFALVSTAYVALNVVVAVNGFGLLRQIEYRRSRDPDDPSLSSLFAMRLRFSYGSAVLWLVACLVAYAVTRHEYLLALTPAAVWLLVEQTTQVWNGISVVDGRAQHLVPSYVTRRLPVVIFLAVALVLDLHMVWSWTLGLAAGSFVSYVQGMRGQEPWARILWPRR
jgi:lipopolysaccharide cholinephosphotransferase